MVAIAEQLQGTKDIVAIPSPHVDPIGEARASYSLFYTMNESDSPRESRSSLARRLQPIFAGLQSGSRVLDLGAGRGIFEAEHARDLIWTGSEQKEVGSQDRRSPIQIVTVDIAAIPQDHLLTGGNPNIRHVQASGTALPFADNTFASGFSNLAIDFMPAQTLTEFRRVVQADAPLAVNLHHPDTITPPGIEQDLYQLQRKLAQKRKYNKPISLREQMALIALKHKVYLKTNDILFQNPDQIEETFTNAGFAISDIRVGNSLRDKWWEVDMTNGPKATEKPRIFAGFDSKEADPTPATVSLVNRFGQVLPSLENGSQVMGIGVETKSPVSLEGKFGREMQERNIVFLQTQTSNDETSIADKSIAAIIGSIGADTLPDVLKEITRVAQPEATITLNVYSQNRDHTEDYYNPRLDEELYGAGLHVSGTTRRETDGKTWWEVDASTMPEVMPQLRTEQPQPRVYGGTDFEFYK